MGDWVPGVVFMFSSTSLRPELICCSVWRQQYKNTMGLLLCLVHFSVVNDDTKLGGEVDMSEGRASHLTERPRQAGGVDWQEQYEV